MRSKFGIVAIATAALVAAIAGTSCNKEEQKTGFKEKTAVSWTPSDESYTIRVGETAKVEGTLLYDDGQTVTLEAFCTSDNPEVVRADGGLGVLGIAQGTATVNAQVRLYRNGNLSAPADRVREACHVHRQGRGQADDVAGGVAFGGNA